MNQHLYTQEQTERLPRGYLFNLLLFMIFVLPVWELATFQLGPVITNMREVCLVLLPAVYFFYPRRNDTLRIETKYWILAFFLILIATELIKKVQHGLAPFDAVKNFRVTLPVLSAMLICLQGNKIDSRFCIKTILVAIIISYILTPLLVFLGIEPSTFSVEGRELQVEYMRSGRFVNKNFEFSLLGIAFLFYIPKIRTMNKGLKRWLMVASVLSVLMLILSFNRTMMAAAALLGLYLLITNLETRTLGYLLVTAVVAGSIAGYFYLTNPNIQRQVDRRILVVFEEEEGLAESVYYDNRDMLYAAYLDQLDAHWLLGLPGGEVLVDMGDVMSTKSDISFFNIWIRYGVIALLLFVIVLVAIYLDFKKRLEYLPRDSLSHQIGRGVLVTVPLFVLASFNVDILVAHNAILFLLLFINFFEVKRLTPQEAERSLTHV